LQQLHEPDSSLKEDFETYYMKQLTAEFGDDLNSLRQAQDFTDKSLPMLVKMLKSGTRGFSEEEMRIVVGEK